MATILRSLATALAPPGRGNSLPSTHMAELTVKLLAARGLGRVDLTLLGTLTAMAVAVVYLRVH